ncbi:hypothetical protein LMG23994_03997 [Cupriavidus pinatubonensis]|uniref:Uncharacterized protein n=1 Tax=Cupriavidus pinatubonensis TaxID=248026 RepID=A0ABN7Z381_9BURK|nr:hypothetical protein LMG23994_03997 [Cupriavidus pinatubonensis]
MIPATSKARAPKHVLRPEPSRAGTEWIDNAELVKRSTRVRATTRETIERSRHLVLESISLLNEVGRCGPCVPGQADTEVPDAAADIPDSVLPSR